jgi:hypothetical protein
MTKSPRTLWIAGLILALTLACFRDPRPRPALEFDPLELPAAQVDVAYEATITVSQNVTPVYWMQLVDGALPDGLTLEYHEHDSFAKIVGTPTRAGTFKFSVGAACLGTSVNGQMGQKEYVIEVK